MDQNDKNNKNRRGNRNLLGAVKLVAWALVLTLVFYCTSSYMGSAGKQASNINIKYSDFIAMMESKQVEDVTVDLSEGLLYIVPKDGYVYAAENGTAYTKSTDQDGKAVYAFTDADGKEHTAALKLFTVKMESNDTLVERMHEAGKTDYDTKYEPQMSPLLLFAINFILPFVFIMLMFSLIMRIMSKKGMGGMGGIGGVGKANAKVYMEKQTGVTFADVAGQDEAKESLTEIIDFLHNPKKYTDIGAKLPKGALLVGPPGTGKTLLARAVAGEAGVPFFSIAGSEFVEMFVGMGASKVRDLFKQAGEKAPCIVFIDEIDTIGKKRDGGSNLGGNDEREQTLNQLLTEMDGFDATKGVVILAATNRPESLDPALTRPGRFDRRVPVELPDLKGRESILRLHAKKVKLGPDCDFGVVARMTPGASGAELANIVNEAALCAVRHRRKAVTQFDLQEAVDTILAGAQKKNKILNNKEKCIVSYHEVGHALVAALQTNSAPVQKITIVPRTSGALGFTMQVEDGDHTLMTKEEILNKIATLTGGRAAEELIFHSITTGASNDIEQATKLARALVTRYGMTEDFDMVALETVNNAYLGGDASLACSEQTAAQVDAKVVEIVQAEHRKAYQMLADNKRKLDEIAQYLYEKETISGEEFMRILNAQPQLPAGPSADSTNQAQ